MNRRAAPAAVWAALLVVYVLWGSTYLAIRVLVRTAPPMTSSGLRFLIAGVVLALGLRLRRGRGAVRAGRRSLAAAALVGVLLLAGGNGGIVLGERSIPSGVASLLVAAVPLWVVGLRAATGDRPPPRTLLGVLVGIVGLAVLVLPGNATGHVPWGGALLILGGSLSWAIGSFLSPRIGVPGDAMVATVWQMLAGGAAMVVIGVAGGELRGLAFGDVAPTAWVAFGYLIVFGSLAGFTAYVWLIAHAPLSLVATYAYVNPVVAVALGALLLAEPITGAVLAGSGLVVLGVALVILRERPRSRFTRPAR